MRMYIMIVYWDFGLIGTEVKMTKSPKSREPSDSEFHTAKGSQGKGVNCE